MLKPRSQRGSQLIELMLMLPAVLWGLTAVWWLMLSGIQVTVGIYAQWMAARTATLAWRTPQQAAAVQAAAIDPRVLGVLERVTPQIRHVPTVPSAVAVGGDNPLQLSELPEVQWSF